MDAASPRWLHDATIGSRHERQPGRPVTRGDGPVVALFDEGLELLTESQCLERLGRVRIGRVAVSIGALPAVFPVNFVFIDGNVYFLTGEGTKLRAATQGAVVAFEVDEFDPFTDAGWSVLVVGQATEVADPATRGRVVAGGLRTSAGGDRHHLVRLGTDLVSGRSIAPPG
jgi:nitroimidazol reductase NimA-like FMN-containing flavoprotein (pyridoxamine 5'-phosphate oxidase superfamily)